MPKSEPTNVKALNIFDFDDTLIRTVGPVAYKIVQSRLPFSYDDLKKNRNLWWDSWISLDAALFDFTAIGPVYDMYKIYENDGTALNVIITNRNERLIPKIRSILKSKNIVTSEIHAVERAAKKSEFLNKLLKQHAETETIRIFEDSLSNMKDYADFIKKQSKEYSVSLYFVNAAYTFEIDSLDFNIISKKENILIH